MTGIAATVTFRLKIEDKKYMGLRGETWNLGKERGLLPSDLAARMVEHCFQFWLDACPDVTAEAAEHEITTLQRWVAAMKYNEQPEPQAEEIKP